MLVQSLLKLLCTTSRVIPAVRSIEDFNFAVEKTIAPKIIVLFSDIILLPTLLEHAHHYNKGLLIHIDLLHGIGKDEAGVKFLARMGVNGLITTKSHLCRIAHEEGMLVIQRIFLTDSEAMQTGVNLLHKFKPDAVEILPASVPASIVERFKKETGLLILGGGLMSTPEDIQSALHNGFAAVSVSRRELWRGLVRNKQ